MCEFQKINLSPEGKELPPMCDYTKAFCTLCVLGNSQTYNKAIKQGENNNDK